MLAGGCCFWLAICELFGAKLAVARNFFLHTEFLVHIYGFVPSFCAEFLCRVFVPSFCAEFFSPTEYWLAGPQVKYCRVEECKSSLV
jgi:hypothetical protein